jgi:hypothetical protein
VLSRGKGVPETTRAARERASALLRQLQDENRVTAIREVPIGLEGERRICATFASASDAAATAARLREIGSGVELFNVEEGPCATSGTPPTQKQGAKQ